VFNVLGHAGATNYHAGQHLGPDERQASQET